MIFNFSNILTEIISFLIFRDITRLCKSNRKIYTICSQATTECNTFRLMWFSKMSDCYLTKFYFVEHAFIASIHDNMFEVFKEILERKLVKPDIYNNEAIVVACEKGYINFVEYLLKCPEVKANVRSNICLYLATTKHHTDVINVLIKHSQVNVN